MSDDRDLALLQAQQSDKKCWCGGRVNYKRPSPEANPILACLDSDFHVWDSTGRPTHVSKIYVAGPMTGYKDNNYPEFNRVSSLLRDAGYQVINPAEFGSDGGHYVDLLREDLRVMLDCQGVAFHGDWWESSGARNEINVAGLLRMPVRHYREWWDRAHHEIPQHQGAHA